MTQKVKNEEIQRRNMLILGGIVGVVVLALAAIVLLQSNSAGSGYDYSGLQQTRTEDGAFLLGDPDAPVTVVAFEDFLCPHCQRYQDTIKEFVEQYVETGQANFEYRMLPAVDPVFSVLSGQLAECSVEQDASFWDAHDTLFAIASSERFNNTSARTFAERMNLNYAELLECVSEADQVMVDSDLASSIGVSGTPTVGIRFNGERTIRLNLLPQQPTVTQLGAVIANNQ